MALKHSFESSGNILFRYRGQIPIVLFLLAVPIVYFTNYSFISEDFICILTVLAVLISILGFIIRAYSIGTTPKGTSGRNRKEQVAESLNITGIYSIVRHPLYIGNYLIWIGIVIFTFNIYFFLIVSLFFWLYYERIMFAEESFLERKFGEQFIVWSNKVPAFIPSFRKFVKSNIPFSFKTILRREYSGVLATAVGYAFIDLLRIYFATGQFDWQRISVYVTIAALVLAIVLRALKHNHFLDEEGRS